MTTTKFIHGFLLVSGMTSIITQTAIAQVPQLVIAPPAVVAPVAPPAVVPPVVASVVPPPGVPVAEDYGRNKRISFMVGMGASHITSELYQDPIVNKTNNNVIIANTGRTKTSLTLGIAYTPYVYDITSTIRTIKADGSIEKKKVIEHVPKGFTFAAFLNPVSLTKVTQIQPFFNMVDFGIGIGHRTAGGVTLLLTGEFFSVNQPRQWFVDQFKDNNKQYVIGGSPQTTIDPTDNSIFTNKIVITFGFKVCYTFDIIKNYYNNSQSIAGN